MKLKVAVLSSLLAFFNRVESLSYAIRASRVVINTGS